MDFDMGNVNFLVNGAKQSRFDSVQWFRYLRKEIVNGKACLSQDEISFLLNHEELTLFQKVSLKRAMTEGSPTFLFAKKLNEPMELALVPQLLRRLRHHESQGSLSGTERKTPAT